MVIRGPLRPTQRTYGRHPDQLALPLPPPSRRRIVRWQPGDPVYPPPEPVDPDPRPAVLTHGAEQDADRDDTDPHPDAATWRAGEHEDGPLSGAASGRWPGGVLPGRRRVADPPCRRRSLVE